VAGRPPKSLAEHVRDATFRSSRHAGLLAGPDLPWPGLALIQHRFRAATSTPERSAVAREFENAIALIHETATRENAAAGRTLKDELADLGKPGSVKQLLAFFPGFLAHPKGMLFGQPFTLERWQQAFLREFHRKDRHGRRLYRRGLLGLPRGNGKTALAAGCALHDLVTRTDVAEVYFAAGSKEQAGIALDFARGFVEHGPLADRLRVKQKQVIDPSGGAIKVLSAEGALQHGRAPSASIIDELWAFETERLRQLYIALSTALHKRQDSYLLAITTAGYDKTSLLGEIYQHALDWQITRTADGCLTVAKDLDNGYLLWWYGAPDNADPDNPKIIRAVNPASWVSVEELLRQLNDPGVGELEFRRLHLNQWTAARDAWLPGSTWDNLKSELEIPNRGKISVGVDVGILHDATAVAWAYRHPDGRIILRAHVFSARDDALAHTHVPGGRVQLSQVEAFIRRLGQRYRIQEIAYDPRYFERSAEILEKAGFKMIEFLQAFRPDGRRLSIVLPARPRRHPRSRRRPRLRWPHPRNRRDKNRTRLAHPQT
jgi:phage terminase large subunit-like protein